MRARRLLGLTPLLIACGCSSGTLNPDAASQGGDAETIDGEPGPTDGPAPVLTGRRSFVVTSTLTLHTDGGIHPTGVPQSHVFTVVADADRGIVFVGANGNGAARPLEITATGLAIPYELSIVIDACSSSVMYTGLTFTLDPGGQLVGSGTGRVYWTPGGTDVGGFYEASMSLTGINDTEAPVFTAVSNAADRSDPFASLTLAASEPLPPDARPVLVGQSGDVTFVTTTAGGYAISFYQPKLLRYAEQYRVALDGVVDFAGNAARTASNSEIQFTTRAAPPLAAEDGFESVTGTSFGGAQVLSGTGAPVIAGARSLYVPATSGSSMPGSVAQQTQLALRLPLAPGDTVVRFAYRIVNPNGLGGASIVIASPGGTFAATALTSTAGSTGATIPGQGAVQLGMLLTAEISLPPDAATEIVIARIIPGVACSGLPVSPIAGLIIDDLRAE